MYANVKSATVLGVDSYIVEVETDISNGIPAFDIVGLPDSAVREARERVKAAIRNKGIAFPIKRITTNLAPADIRKEGSGFDLAIAISILVASGQLLQSEVDNYLFIGELSLEGRLRSIPGVLSIVMMAKQHGINRVFVPKENIEEACLVKDIEIFGVEDLGQVIDHLLHSVLKPFVNVEIQRQQNNNFPVDFSDVQGQAHAKRALEVAAAGGHNVIFVGPPGSGKTMLARRISTILPETTMDEALHITRIYSVAGLMSNRGGLITERPFRTPHHTISQAGLTGGGSVPKPGEISLAHNGLLFLDELPEFEKSVLEGLRQPLEDGKITISRARVTLTYPADFTLICAMNPCPCGFYGYEDKQSGRRCSCTQQQVQRYRSKISGPLMDRIDLQLEVPRVDYATLSNNRKNESSEVIRSRVWAARKIQYSRYREHSQVPKFNARLESSAIRKYCKLTEESSNLLKDSFDKLGLSARAYDRILRVARTIADLAGQDMIQFEHIAEAIQYRSLDRGFGASVKHA